MFETTLECYDKEINEAPLWEKKVLLESTLPSQCGVQVGHRTVVGVGGGDVARSL